MGGSLNLDLAVPVLGGRAVESLCDVADGREFSSTWVRGLRNATITAGVAAIPTAEGADLEAKTTELYRDLLEVTKGRSLYRVWNFVPRINADDAMGTEHYHAFNSGRWKAFHERYGEGGGEALESRFPAASAVGVEGDDSLGLLFVAGELPVTYIENPRQVPAYHYPPEHGPCSPSFARAATTSGLGVRVGYLSGTSSIYGHRTVGEGDLRSQFEETVANVRAALEQMEVDPLDPATAAAYRVYVREAESYPLIREWFEEAFGADAEAASYLQADICRAPLKLEVEGIFRTPVASS